MHAVPADLVDEYFALVQIVKEAASWAGTQEVWMAESNMRDAQSITDPPLVESNPDHQKSPPVAEVKQDQRSAHVWTHRLVAAQVFPTDQGKVFACMACGAYAFKRRGKLVEACRGHPSTQWMRKQKERLEANAFPGPQKLTIGPLRQLLPEELDSLVQHARAHSVSDKQVSAAASECLKTALGPSNILAEFGIVSNQQLQRWVQVAKYHLARLLCEESVEECSDDED